MSNKRQKKISQKMRDTTFIRRRNGRKQRCDLKTLGAYVYSLLFTSSILCIVASAKLEIVTDIDSKQSTTEAINYEVDENVPQQHENQLEYENFYHSELKRLPYETINRILRDEEEPIFRREDIDLRYYHARSLQPTHEVVRRSAEEKLEINSNLNLRAQNLTKFKIALNSTKNLEKIITIDVSVNNLETIELNYFKNLRTANLSHNILTEIPITRNSTIELLNLNSNRIQKSQVLRNDHLRILYLSGNNIENFTALNLSLLNALETLDLSCNQIKNLETTFFPRLMHNLKYLNLANNQLGSISRETFYNLLSLNTLLLAHNNITFIDYETFLSLPNLQYLDLSHNQLKGESIRALQGIPDLIGLSIAYNPEMGESLQEFVASWSLKEVDASGTGLCQIPAALAQAVRTLKLADNWFKIINCGDLDSYPLLQHLDLSFSQIEDIEDDAMGRLEFLEILFLDHNQLRKVPISLPTSLEHLFLQYNEIMDLQVQAFQGLKNLKTLDLSHNKLLYLPALPLPKLLTLNLQASGLQGLNQAIVHSLPHLRDLLLEENPIKCSDLLGIAEWASPCRIAERANTKALDSEQIGNVDLGQQQQQQHQQTVAKIDLKQQFVQTHNFYEKFNNNGGCCCSNAVVRQMLATTTPPSCAIELDDNVEEVKKSTTMWNVTETSTENVEDQQKLLHETTTKQIDAHSNEERKVYEHNFLTSDLNIKLDANSTGLTKTQTEDSTKMNVLTTTQPTIQINANNISTLSSQMTTTEFATKIFEITTVTTTPKTTESTNIVTVMPKTTFSAINSEQKAAQITAMLVPTTLIASTSELNNSSETTTVSTENFLPQAMPTKIPTTMTTAASNYAMQYTSTRGSLLERQRRVEVEETTMTTTDKLAIMDKTLATTLTTKTSDKSSGKNIGNDNDNRHDSDETNRKYSKTFEFKNFENVKQQKTISTNATTDGAVTTLSTTLSPTQHKHVTLQLHVKDRHLIGTPLLTHHGQNLLVASDDFHITTKPTTLSTTLSTPLTTISNNLAKHQIKELKTHLEIDKLNGSDNLELSTIEEDFVGKQTTTSTMTTTRRPASKIAKKPQKKLSLIMKKMTFTTKHANSTIAPNSLNEDKQTTKHYNQHHQHHHYTLNIPRENEVTVMVKSPTETFFNSNQHESNSLKHHQLHHNNIKHSTVNTPITNGHQHELQTFQEHNELEEAAAVAAASAHAHASTSAIVGKITKTGLTTTTSTSAKWFDLRKNTTESTHPGIVILLSFGLFVILLIGLLHVYRCDIPWPLRRQRHQQRPYRIHQQQQLQQQTHLNDDDVHSFLSYQSNCSNQFNQRKWRLGTTQKQQQEPRTEQHNQQKQQQQQQQQQEQQHQQHQHQSPFHNLQVRELQQTSAIESGPKYAKPTYKISNALGERSNSQTSSTCSPHSSNIFDDETFYIEMTTDIVHEAINNNANTLGHSDLLPMELLNVSKGAIGKNDELEYSSSKAVRSDAFQTSSFDEHATSSTTTTTLQSSSKRTPTTRKLGIW